MAQRRTRQLCALVFLIFVGLAARPGAAQVWLAPSYPDRPLLGAEQAKGAVIWSHGRSFAGTDSEAPSPPYLMMFRDAGWDVFRFNRSFEADRLTKSADALAGFVAELKERGYGRVVLAGQSFGAFVSLIAAGGTDAIDAVIATAPAAYGSFFDSHDSWRDNARRLYPLLRSVRSARVMLFFFHGDEYDPGGRGERSRAILAARPLDHVVIDQPADLAGHGAAATGLFARRFGDCLLRFAEKDGAVDDASCEEPWGERPSVQLTPPDRPAASSGGTTDADGLVGRWYGFYRNGREVLLTVERVDGGAVIAGYGLGPGLTPNQPAEWDRRRGRVVDGALVFDEAGKNRLRFRRQPNGALAATWQSLNGAATLETMLHRLDG